jgi:hypothetical protein
MKDFETIAHFVVNLRVNAETNARMHWAKRARVSREHRKFTAMATNSNLFTENAWAIAKDNLDVCVRLTRRGKRMLDDDNLATAFKHVRDGVADAIGIDDGSERYTWEYAQVKGTEYKVEIEIGVRSHKRK